MFPQDLEEKRGERDPKDKSSKIDMRSITAEVVRNLDLKGQVQLGDFSSGGDSLVRRVGEVVMVLEVLGLVEKKKRRVRAVRPRPVDEDLVSEEDILSETQRVKRLKIWDAKLDACLQSYEKVLTLFDGELNGGLCYLTREEVKKAFTADGNQIKVISADPEERILVSQKKNELHIISLGGSLKQSYDT